MNTFSHTLTTNNSTSAHKAAAHFLELYAEEIKAREVTKDTIHEWWNMTKEQYPDTNLVEVEHLIRF